MKPKLNLSSISTPDLYVLQYITDNAGYLIDCPKFDTPNFIKLIHHWLLFELGECRKWIIPVPGTWHTPHIPHYKISESVKEWTQKYAKKLVNSGCFI